MKKLYKGFYLIIFVIILAFLVSLFETYFAKVIVCFFTILAGAILNEILLYYWIGDREEGRLLYMIFALRGLPRAEKRFNYLSAGIPLLVLIILVSFFCAWFLDNF